MGIFDRFKNRKKDVLPEEVDNYYKSQRRARIGTAWLLGFLTLIITLIIALGLFYGIRYAYREITDSNDTTDVVPVDENGAQTTPGEDDAGSDNDTGTTDGTEPLPGETGDGADNGGRQQTNPTPEAGDRLPSNGDAPLPAAGDPGL
jgi:hypothetical protein